MSQINKSHKVLKFDADKHLKHFCCLSHCTCILVMYYMISFVNLLYWCQYLRRFITTEDILQYDRQTCAVISLLPPTLTHCCWSSFASRGGETVT